MYKIWHQMKPSECLVCSGQVKVLEVTTRQGLQFTMWPYNKRWGSGWMIAGNRRGLLKCSRKNKIMSSPGESQLPMRAPIIAEKAANNRNGIKICHKIRNTYRLWKFTLQIAGRWIFLPRICVLHADSVWIHQQLHPCYIESKIHSENMWCDWDL